MKRIFNSVSMLFLLLLSTAVTVSGDEPRLHPFYEQNGDCYLLIGEGSARAVWALNNLTSGIADSLYDPYDAYGITATQKWNNDLARSDKDLFTFAGEEEDKVSLSGRRVPRRIIMNATTSVYPFDEVPPCTVHRFHSDPNSSTTGLGNHGAWTITSLFAGIDYPCNTIPDAVATMPGYYWYPVGQGYYHAADIVVWSNWTYSDNRRIPDDPPPVEQQYNPITDGSPPTKGPWAVCCAGSRPGSGWIMGGWVRRMVRENLWGAYRNIKLFKYRVDSGASLPELVKSVANVLASISGTMDLNGECCDGCIAKDDDVAMPGVASPYLSTSYSAIVDRTYLYRRDQGSVDFTLNGTTTNDEIIGDGSDLTCQFLGISSKSDGGNFVYLLGLNKINQWLKDANATDAMLLNELTDVAVSDQWWQTGGIVYAYDATKGKVYRFVRNEGGTHGTPGEIDVSAGGIIPDSIGADGFGSLYLMKTEFDPASTTAFLTAPESRRYFVENIAGGIKRFRAEYKQNVYKRVYVRDYFTGIIDSVPGRVLIGTNTFYRDYMTADNMVNSAKIWLMSEFGQSSPIVNTALRTELAVINSPTPPRPGNLDALTDCMGPLVAGDAGFEAATPDENGDFTDDMVYWFAVENAPYFDANEVNTGNSGEDQNGNLRIGKFPNTVQKSSISYYWKVIQTHDRFGEPLVAPSTILDMEADRVGGDYLFLFPPSAGKFRVGVKVTYRYYDYRDLPVGALSSRKGEVLKPAEGLDPLVAVGEDGDGYAWSSISVKAVDPIIVPEDKGVIMSGIFNSSDPADGMKSNFKPGPQELGFGCANSAYGNESCGHTYCDPENNELPAVKFVIDGKSLVPEDTTWNSTSGAWEMNYSEDAAVWSLQLRESNYNLSRGVNRIVSMTNEEPPDLDEDTIDGTLEWAGGLSITWKSMLKRGEEIIIDRQLVTSEPLLTLSQLRTLMPVPSDPGNYTVSVDFRRTYRYEIYQAVYRRVGSDMVKEFVAVPRVVTMKIWSDAEILVTDNTPPAKFYVNPIADTGNSTSKPVSPAYFMRNEILYGTTGEGLQETESPPAANPGTLVFVVADNNPLANSSLDNPAVDPYHAGVADVGGRLRARHDLNNQLATFSYQTHIGAMPPLAQGSLSTADYLAMRKWYSSGNSDAYKVSVANIDNEETFNSTTLTSGLYNKTFSYRRYQISLSDLKHFSKEIARDANNQWEQVGDWSPRMHIGRANNSTGYKNLVFGLAWREACYSDTNNLSIEAQQDGQIVIRDNDRPNAFIRASQDKHVGIFYFSPSGLQADSGVLPPKWIRFATPGMNDALYNGPESWTDSDLTAFFDPMFRSEPTSPITNRIFPAGSDLEVDVPVRFDALAVDNAGQISTLTYQLLDGADTLLVDGMFTTPMQYVFRDPGRYKIILKVSDDAKTWPSNPKAYAPGETDADPGVASANNERSVEVVFDVVPTRLDYRVIDRHRTGE